MESKISSLIKHIDSTQKLFYNSQNFKIPKSYLDNIDLLFTEKNLSNFLNDTNQLKILEKFLPSGLVITNLAIRFSFILFLYINNYIFIYFLQSLF